MIKKSIVYADHTLTHACDGRCDKAWGINLRPRAFPVGNTNPDDYALLADHELKTAPIDPGTYEGGHAKPRSAEGPDDINKWCVRECERAWSSPHGEPRATPDLPDFSTRLYNIAPHKREAASTEPKVTKLIDDLAASINATQAGALLSDLDATQTQAFTEILGAATKKERS